MPSRTIPTDTAKAADITISDLEWARSMNAHERFKAVLETKQRAKARRDAALAQITVLRARRDSNPQPSDP